MKTLRDRLRRDRAFLPLPRSAQEILPIQRLWEDGIFLTGGQFSKSWRFPDINYAVAAEADKEAILRAYGDLLNALDAEVTVQISLCNRRVNREAFARDVLLPLRGDDLDLYRREYNDMLLRCATEGNRMLRERYITVSLHRRDIAEARLAFSRIGTELSGRFAALGSALSDLLGGYFVYIAPTFLIKGAMGLIAGRMASCEAGRRMRNLPVFLLCEVVMIAGYFLFESALYGVGAALGAVIPNAIQGAFGVGVGIALAPVATQLREYVR